MFVESVKTFQFRNLKDGNVTLSPGMVCLVGENGQGKTNIVEAISLISFGRSFRTTDTKDLQRWGCQAASVFAVVGNAHNEKRSLGIVMEGGKRRGIIDGNPCRSVAELFSLLRCVAFSPTDLALISGGPSDRRRFFDRHTVDIEPELVWCFVEYQRALKSKQVILRGNSSMGAPSRQALSPWNALLSESGAKIVNARTRILSAMEPILAHYSALLFDDPAAITLKLKGPSTHLLTERSGTEVQASELLAQLEEAADREISLERTAVGPHRDDIVPYLFGHDARAFASQGQSRSIVLVLKLAIVELITRVTGESPVVLLDDVDSELDAKRRHAIFSSMAKQSGQLIITCTEKRMPEEIERQISQTLHVENGQIRD